MVETGGKKKQARHNKKVAKKSLNISADIGKYIMPEYAAEIDMGKKIGKKIIKGAGAKKSNPWVEHVKAYQAKHPKLTYKECMTKAKASYKPKKK